MSSLPIHQILWAPSNKDHYNHLHVEGSPKYTGTPPSANPGMSPSVQVIYEALRHEFGTPYYFQDAKPAEPCWSHMGWYNRRKISGSNTWSQHAWSNALDVGPYYGVDEQQKFYDFLTGADMPDGDWKWNKDKPEPIDGVLDADKVLEFQGTFAPGQKQASYDPATFQEANDRVWVVLARIADWAMRNAK